MLYDASVYQYVRPNAAKVHAKFIPNVDGTGQEVFPLIENLYYCMEAACEIFHWLKIGSWVKSDIPSIFMADGGRTWNKDYCELIKIYAQRIATFCSDFAKCSGAIGAPYKVMCLDKDWQWAGDVYYATDTEDSFRHVFESGDVVRACDELTLEDVMKTDEWRRMFYDLNRMRRLLIESYHNDGDKYTDIHQDDLSVGHPVKGPFNENDADTILDYEQSGYSPSTQTLIGFYPHSWQENWVIDESTGTVSFSSRLKSRNRNLYLLVDYVRAKYISYPPPELNDSVTVWMNLGVGYKWYEMDYERHIYVERSDSFFVLLPFSATIQQNVPDPLKMGPSFMDMRRMYMLVDNWSSTVQNDIYALVANRTPAWDNRRRSLVVECREYYVDMGTLKFQAQLPNSWNWTPPQS